MKDVLADLVAKDEYLYNGDGFTNKLPTGIVTLDIALGGGIPLNGAIVELWGVESSGKTTLTYRICKRCTDLSDGYVTWCDSEGSYDTSWASVQGLTTDKVIVYRPPYMEAAIDTILSDIKRYKEKFLPWLVDKNWRPAKEDAERAGLGISNVEGIKEYMSEHAPVHVIAWDSIAASPVKSVAEAGSEFSEGMALVA